MALSIYIIKKYIKIMMGRNDMTVNQDEGKCYSVETIEGYYNNLTEKITKFGCQDNSVPISEPAPGVKMEFSIAVFQYGLAAYDLFLISKKERYLEILKTCADWALAHQDSEGGWPTFTYKRPDQLYSAMAQGEGISMLIRAHKAFKDEKYTLAVHKAKDFMMRSINDGGTAEYNNDKIYLYEYLNAPLVLNGWIFAAWGLFDYAKYYNNQQTFCEWNRTIKSMAAKLPEYDCGYWSMYDDCGGMANPFYHKLHITLLHTMYEITGIEEFNIYHQRFKRYQSKMINRIRSFVFKIWQKITEKD